MLNVHYGKVTATVIALVVSVGVAAGATFDDYDTSEDNKISQQEFLNQVRVNESFENTDSNQDRFIDENEFSAAGIAGEFNRWDTNEDGAIDQDEYYGATFHNYDTNGDGYWDNNEWDDAISDGWFAV